MTIESNITWRDYQAEVIDDIINDNGEGNTYVICSPRQCGKSTVCEALLLYFAINNNDSFSMMVSPTYKQCNKVFNEVKKAIQNTSVFSAANESSLIITFYNGSKIVFASGEGSISSLQGYTIKNGLMIFDETAYLTDDVIQALLPATDVFKCPVVFASTPRFRSGTFYDYFIEGQNENSCSVKSYNWKGHSTISPEKLEFYRRTLPRDTFTNYYIGDFVTIGNGVFGDFSEVIQENKFNPLNINDIANNVPQSTSIFERVSSCVFGIDWSSGVEGDSTAISVFNYNREQIYLDYFNNLDETQTIDRIIILIKKFHPDKVNVETNGIGRIFFGLLQKAVAREGINTSITGFNTSNKSKMDIISDMQLAIQNHNISLLNDDNLINQFNTYEAVLSSSGNVIYNAHKGAHDDIVIATLLGYNALKKGNYCIA